MPYYDDERDEVYYSDAEERELEANRKPDFGVCYAAGRISEQAFKWEQAPEFYRDVNKIPADSNSIELVLIDENANLESQSARGAVIVTSWDARENITLEGIEDDIEDAIIGEDGDYDEAVMGDYLEQMREELAELRKAETYIEL